LPLLAPSAIDSKLLTKHVPPASTRSRRRGKFYLHETDFRPEPENKTEYGQSYYQDKMSKMKEGYVHPYHTSANPLFFSHYNYLKTLFEAVGPE
jgi:hypothetical protein